MHTNNWDRPWGVWCDDDPAAMMLRVKSEDEAIRLCKLFRLVDVDIIYNLYEWRLDHWEYRDIRG